MKWHYQTSCQLLSHKVSAAESILAAFTTELFYNIPLFPAVPSYCFICLGMCAYMWIDIHYGCACPNTGHAWKHCLKFDTFFPLSSSPLDTVTHFVGSWHWRRFEGVHLDLVKGCGVGSSPHTHTGPLFLPGLPLPYWLSATLSV